jgi:hypothetical protein
MGMGQKLWDKWGLVKRAREGMWEEVTEAEKKGVASEDEVMWEVERGCESEDRIKAWKAARMRSQRRP